MKTKRKKPGKPHGATYADILAEKQARMRAIDKAEQVTGEKLEYYIDVELKEAMDRMI